MNKDKHMILQACEEIIANQGRMSGIDETLLDNLEFCINIHLRERAVGPNVDKVMTEFDSVIAGLREPF
jgi:hypothetical protein